MSSPQGNRTRRSFVPFFESRAWVEVHPRFRRRWKEGTAPRLRVYIRGSFLEEVTLGKRRTQNS